ncbi:MAG: hypothetical protein AUJ49_11125 [Desulfovibrionaceae bacterium CG1_02_65_16]|nr:MAG: hypothetical protein AUJ49_11125 [Desulfovibrionaceae bacterium CG1_02_65_16]
MPVAATSPGEFGGFDVREGSGWGRRLAFGAPYALRRACALADVPDVVDWAEAESRAGRWAVLVLAFEAAPAFDPALTVHAPRVGLPLAWAASHAAPLPDTASGSAFSDIPPYAGVGPWRALVPPSSYAARFAQLQAGILDGETYQANYTVPFERAWPGGDDGRAWFARLAAAQSAGFCVWLDMGRHRVLSLSPELFFRLDAEQGTKGREGARGLLARPMKGTAPRGADALQGGPLDAALRQGLARCPKNRAENVMIVDLLRSDLGRVARTGSVRVPRLFRVEAYPTLFQMTSDVRAQLAPGLVLRDVLAALFPCGSVTGAPKVRTMQILRELEPHPRGVYCGAIGLLEPGREGQAGAATFSVPIRTVEIDAVRGQARFGVGGGITHYSDARGEYSECLTKMRFLLSRQEDCALLESLLLLDGRYPLLAGHRERLTRSAEALGFALDMAAALRVLEDLARNHPRGRFKARLLLERSGLVRAEASPISRGGMAGAWRAALRVGFASMRVDPDDGWLAHKTTRRALYEQALAACPGCDDALLVNTRGEVTESTRANLVLLLDGRLATPPLASGLLPGVFRAGLLRRGIVRERVLFPGDVARAGRVWLINAVRWWMPCLMV